MVRGMLLPIRSAASMHTSLLTHGPRKGYDMTDTLRLLVATLKGGPGKTTTAVLLAIALARGWDGSDGRPARRGRRVLLICADTRTRGATDWIQDAERQGYEIPFELAIWHAEDGPLSEFARAKEQATGAEIVIIDTGGEQPEAFVYGCTYANRLISPVGPMRGELRRIVETYRHAMAVRNDQIRRGLPETEVLQFSVLLTRVPQRGRGKAKEAREELASPPPEQPDPDIPWQLGLHVLDVEITRAVAYDEVNCTIPDEVGEYDDLADELVTLHGAR